MNQECKYQVKSFEITFTEISNGIRELCSKWKDMINKEHLRGQLEHMTIFDDSSFEKSTNESFTWKDAYERQVKENQILHEENEKLKKKIKKIKSDLYDFTYLL